MLSNIWECNCLFNRLWEVSQSAPLSRTLLWNTPQWHTSVLCHDKHSKTLLISKLSSFLLIFPNQCYPSCSPICTTDIGGDVHVILNDSRGCYTVWLTFCYLYVKGSAWIVVVIIKTICVYAMNSSHINQSICKSFVTGKETSVNAVKYIQMKTSN